MSEHHQTVAAETVNNNQNAPSASKQVAKKINTRFALVVIIAAVIIGLSYLLSPRSQSTSLSVEPAHKDSTTTNKQSSGPIAEFTSESHLPTTFTVGKDGGYILLGDNITNYKFEPLTGGSLSVKINGGNSLFEISSEGWKNPDGTTTVLMNQIHMIEFVGTGKEEIVIVKN